MRKDEITKRRQAKRRNNEKTPGEKTKFRGQNTIPSYLVLNWSDAIISMQWGSFWMQIHVQNIITSHYSEKRGTWTHHMIVLWISQRQSKQSHDRFINNEKAQTDLRVRKALSEACLLTNIKYGRKWKKVKSCITFGSWTCYGFC